MLKNNLFTQFDNIFLNRLITIIFYSVFCLVGRCSFANPTFYIPFSFHPSASYQHTIHLNIARAFSHTPFFPKHQFFLSQCFSQFIFFLVISHNCLSSHTSSVLILSDHFTHYILLHTFQMLPAMFLHQRML